MSIFLAHIGEFLDCDLDSNRSRDFNFTVLFRNSLQPLEDNPLYKKISKRSIFTSSNSWSPREQEIEIYLITETNGLKKKGSKGKALIKKPKGKGLDDEEEGEEDDEELKDEDEEDEENDGDEEDEEDGDEKQSKKPTNSKKNKKEEDDELDDDNEKKKPPPKKDKVKKKGAEEEDDENDDEEEKPSTKKGVSGKKG